MIGFLSSFQDYKIHFCTNEPDLRDVPSIPDHNWKYTQYGNPKEELSTDAPPPHGKRGILSHYFDANLMHDVLSGKAVTGVVHFWNKTPMDWYSKKQTTSKTATYGSKFLSDCTCFERSIDHKNYL